MTDWRNKLNVLTESTAPCGVFDSETGFCKLADVPKAEADKLAAELNTTRTKKGEWYVDEMSQHDAATGASLREAAAPGNFVGHDIFMNVITVMDSTPADSVPGVTIIAMPDDEDNLLEPLYASMRNATRTLLYAEDTIGEQEDDEVLDLSRVTAAYLFYNESGYRGDGVYGGLVKVDGKWWWADFVSEGDAQRMAITDAKLAQWVATIPK